MWVYLQTNYELKVTNPFSMQSEFTALQCAISLSLSLFLPLSLHFSLSLPISLPLPVSLLLFLMIITFLLLSSASPLSKKSLLHEILSALQSGYNFVFGKRPQLVSLLLTCCLKGIQNRRRQGKFFSANVSFITWIHTWVSRVEEIICPLEWNFLMAHITDQSVTGICSGLSQVIRCQFSNFLLISQPFYKSFHAFIHRVIHQPFFPLTTLPAIHLSTHLYFHQHIHCITRSWTFTHPSNISFTNSSTLLISHAHLHATRRPSIHPSIYFILIVENCKIRNVLLLIVNTF